MISKFYFSLFLIDLYLSNRLTSCARFTKNPEEENSSYWNDLAKKDIEITRRRQDVVKKAKNSILFIGDGMGISTLTAARILKGQLANKTGEEGSLFLETLPNTSLIKTYNVDKQVPDSAGTATAYLNGVKSNYGVIGVGPKVNISETNCSKILENSLDSILELARKSNKSIGLVTTTRLTHASPAASYAHTSDRNHEIDVNFPEKLKQGGCKDIARQLFENEPGISLNVIFGGGRSYFTPKTNGSEGKRKDNRNLIDFWLQHKNNSGLHHEKYKYVSNLQELQTLDTQKVDYVLGVFANNHLRYSAHFEKNSSQPTFSQMVEKAIEILSKNPNGYIFFAEGGRIDHAHHNNFGGLALHDTIEFDNAIEKTLKIINTNDTLVVVSADHSHSFTINGYPPRGNDILGLSGFTHPSTNESFTTLLYSTGPGHKLKIENPLNHTNFNTVDYQQHSTFKLPDSNHGGEDVALYAIGPMSHLFRGLHEQNYIAHVISYSTCIGSYQNETHCH